MNVTNNWWADQINEQYDLLNKFKGQIMTFLLNKFENHPWKVSTLIEIGEQFGIFA